MKIKFLFLILALSLASVPFLAQAQTNPCQGGVIGRQAGRTDWGPFDCSTVTISQDRYEEFRLGEEQLKSVKKQVLDVYELSMENLSLRDSMIGVQREYQRKTDQLLDANHALALKNEGLAEDALKNAEYCEKRLRLSKAKNWIFAIGGAVGGAMIGVLVGRAK